MNRSESICNELGAKFFCKDFVYENLKYYNSSNKKVELCDALFEYASIYVPLQIKERSKNKGAKSEESWLEEVVYGEAVKQVRATVNAIKNNDIVVNDLYHQPVQINKNNLIFPIIVFDNPLINEYQRIIINEALTINVFQLKDYESMMSVIMHPYEIIYYLQERARWLNEHRLPDFVFGDGINSSIIARIKSEGDFSNFFKQYIYEGDEEKQNEALRHLQLIRLFRERQIKKNVNYRQILKILQLIEPKIAQEFMARFDYAWKCACNDKFDFTRAIQVQLDGKKISIVFFAIGKRRLLHNEYYQVLLDAKQLQQKADAILLISFVGEDNDHCQIDWVYYEKQYEVEEYALKFYEEIGMYNGTMDLETYELLCHKLLNNVEE